jgi:uncharacterized surface anchored protein
VCDFPNDLVAGDYTLHESVVPAGYAAVGDIPLTITTSEYGANVAVAAIDKRLPHLTLFKDANNDTTPLPGATFQLLQSGTVLQTCTSDSTGRCDFTDPLVAGDYTLHESVVPDGYAAVDDIPLTITTSEYGNNLAVKTIDKSLPHLSIQKWAIAAGTPLAGATFQLLQSGTVLQTCTSDSTGLCDFADPLVAGDYTLHESGVPAGYAPIPDDPITITTSEDGESIRVALTDPSAT